MDSAILPRRAFLKGLLGLVAAPALVKAENLMPILPWRPEFRVLIGKHGWPNMLAVERVDLAGFDVTSLGLPAPPPLHLAAWVNGSRDRRVALRGLSTFAREVRPDEAPGSVERSILASELAGNPPLGIRRG